MRERTKKSQARGFQKSSLFHGLSEVVIVVVVVVRKLGRGSLYRLSVYHVVVAKRGAGVGCPDMIAGNVASLQKN